MAAETIGLETAGIDSGFTTDYIEWTGTSFFTGHCAYAVELDASNAGVSTTTLGAVTSSADGVVKNQGTTTATLGDVTSSAEGEVFIGCVCEVTLGDITCEARNYYEIHSNETLEDVTSNPDATGKVLVQGALEATIQMSVVAIGYRAFHYVWPIAKVPFNPDEEVLGEKDLSTG